MQLLRSLDLEVLEEKDTATSILDLATVRRSLSDLLSAVRKLSNLSENCRFRPLQFPRL